MNNQEKYRTVRGYELLKRDHKLLTPSMEDYLEMIYRHCEKEGYIRMNELAEQLNIQIPSATKMVQKLAKLDLLKYKKYGIVMLTDQGNKMGAYLLKRHNVVREFLSIIGVEENLLSHTEMIEHSINVEILENINLLIKFFNEESNIKGKFKNFKNNYNSKD